MGVVMVAGVDEVGRGCLAGPVVAAAVILPRDCAIQGIRDSKKLTPRRREHLAIEIKKQAIAWSIAEASVAEIDAVNILHASLLAMQRAIETLKVVPTIAHIDGNFAPQVSIPCKTIVGGDALDQSIGAASIIAKFFRDALMRDLDGRYPSYGLAKHKGYATAAHRTALDAHGAIEGLHRQSFAPVQKVMQIF